MEPWAREAVGEKMSAGLKDHLGDEVVVTEQCIPGRMRVRRLPRMIPRFPDRTVARQQSESQKGVGESLGHDFPCSCDQVHVCKMKGVRMCGSLVACRGRKDTLRRLRDAGKQA